MTDPVKTHGSSPRPRVVVTGIGLFTALGSERESSWKALREGRQACDWLDIPVEPAALPHAGYRSPHPDHRPNMILFKAAQEALRDARLRDRAFDRDRVATVVGMSKGDIRRLAADHRRFLVGGPGASPTDPLHAWPSHGASMIAETWDLRGPCLAPVAACATGLIAALQAADLIRRGVCDLALAGAGDASLEPILLGAFRRMGVLAETGDFPKRAVRPWDRERTGFLVGEGAAVLVLEREDHAAADGVSPYALFAGGAFGGDAHHLTGLDPDPANLAGLITRALRQADLEPSELDHVNVHGTATRANDPLECQALRQALGPHADHVSCSANKAQIGHLLGAAGAVELAFTCLALRDGFVPPTVNLDDPDPRCDLDGTPHTGRTRPIRAALKLSLGFGGHLAAAAIRCPEGPRRLPVETTP